MDNIEFLMELSRSMSTSYTMDDKGPLPIRAISEKIRDITYSFSRDTHKKPRVLILSGLRGVGKTTILFQTMKFLSDNGIENDDIVFLSMDRASFSGKNIRDLVEEYERNIAGENLISIKRGLVFMIDEAHYSRNWGLQIKTLTDEAPNVFFIVTGSSALELSISPDLSRRSMSINIEPLNFLEYLQIRYRAEGPKTNDDNVLERILNAQDVHSALEIFQEAMKSTRKVLRELRGYSPGALEDHIRNGGLPFSIGHIHPERQLYEMIRRVIEKDVPLVGEHDSRTLRSIPSVVGMLAPAPDISMNSISRDIDGLSISSVKAVIDTLKRCKLIFEVEKEGSPSSSIRADTRKYFSSSSLSAAVLSASGRDHKQHYGQLIETAVVSLIYRSVSRANGMSLRYVKGRGMADLIVVGNDSSVAVEVGSGRKELGPIQLRKTISKARSRFGILICDVEKPEVTGNIMKLPLREFLCL